MVELIRFSGYRLWGLPPDQGAYRWAALRSEVAKYTSLVQQLQAPFYMDDGDRQTPIIDLLMAKLQAGEIYFVFNRQQFIGMAAITNIAYGRTAFIEAIATPDARGSYAVGKGTGELLTYAFSDFPSGLGLKKLKNLD